MRQRVRDMSGKPGADEGGEDLERLARPGCI